MHNTISIKRLKTFFDRFCSRIIILFNMTKPKLLVGITNFKILTLENVCLDNIRFFFFFSPIKKKKNNLIIYY